MHVPAEAMVQRAERAHALKQSWYGNIYECWWYAAPGMNPFLNAGDPWLGMEDTAEGSLAHEHLYDSTLARSFEKLYKRLAHDTFTPGQDWCDLVWGTGESSELSRPAQQDLVHRMQRKIFSVVHEVGAYLSLEELVADGTASGTGLIKVSRKSRDIQIDSMNQVEVAFERGPWGQVWGYYRKHYLVPSHIKAMWPGAKNVPAEDAEERTGAKEAEHHTVYEGCYYDYLSGWWHYDVVLSSTGGGGARSLYQFNYPVPPWNTWRYSLLPGEVQGRSPVMAAIPDARTLNGAVQSMLKAASIASVGIWTYTQNQSLNFSTMEFKPGIGIPVLSNSRENPDIAPLEVGGDVRLQQLVLQDLRNSVRETMLDDALPPPEGPVRSATEIIERTRRSRMALGMPAARLIEEVGRPLLSAVAFHLAEMGELEGIEELVEPMADGRPAPLKLDGSDLTLNFRTPLVQAQRLQDAANIVESSEYAIRAAGPRAYEAGTRVELIPARIRELMKVPGLDRPPEEAEGVLQTLQQAALPAPGGPQAGGQELAP